MSLWNNLWSHCNDGTQIKICTVRNQLLLLEFHWTVKFGWPPTSLNYSKQHHFISLSLYWDCKDLYNKLIKLFCFCLSFCCCSVKLSLNCVMSSLKHSVVVICYFPQVCMNEFKMVIRQMQSYWGLLASSPALWTPEIAWILLTSRVWRPWNTGRLRHTNHPATNSLPLAVEGSLVLVISVLEQNHPVPRWSR